MRNKVVGVIALVLGGGAILRNIVYPQPFNIADWALPVVFVIAGIYLLTKK
jgi:hypothetical protein